MTAAVPTIHATCVAVAGEGILIRGEPGAGKSVLALQLLERCRGDGVPAALVGDDRVALETVGAVVVARGHPAIEGLIEMRGVGLCRVETCAQAPLRLVVDLVTSAPRVPEDDGTVALHGVRLRRLVLERGLCRSGLAPLLVLRALAVSSQPHSRTGEMVLDLRP
ncbi:MULTISPECIES: HPr kinase/phosphatase C-terminal domain-containing protein [Methylobacterium]|uniref:HPr kinase/phosphorylase n=3 Tax=Pseudomonadota TaxID=1224 RepID=A0ABQ4SUT4_9HYPH|nr:MULTISPECIES: HPr kinase/phosphatase C-terminal domain-containing protein [Methylobacterium]PIU07033.1 MAG: hypothetical protein COT56_06465 [Methylobacterium sp. CG09_land_8_20_14_0_10_71_15]PIU12238.1 MAG: hypothetical protein COT28_15665 [Methylobacterium sp. CG08_land_8_20_14_0_20_71_15]GBU16720.1 hypothetical protein AwMethylo_09350 [Methylobacterium sp.]GJE05451.1 HPr kinase/phosphorylase [Methylobacterium jeotgali]